ncbi:MAG: cell wall-binding repeat-containing protein, partial [Desulfitobacterium hafniense]|nr:cell wall-binding repeat-containing protein [Desulfitobacterium hafniense]
VTNVYVTSGIGVIRQPVLDELKALNINIISLGGADRFETATNIAFKLGMPQEIVVATAWSNADALSIAAIAAAKQMPILLSEPDKLSEKTKAYLVGSSPFIKTTYVLGGTGALSPAVETFLPNPKRLGGTDRFETNMLVLTAFSPVLTGNSLYVANGENSHLVDALTGSVLAEKNGTAILLTSNKMPDKTKEFAKLLFPLKEGVLILGGESVVPQTEVAQAFYFENFASNSMTLGSDDGGTPTEYSDNVQITGNNVTVRNADFANSIYIAGNNASLSNLNVQGAVILEPGTQGTTTLDNVTARSIVILENASGTFKLKNVNAKSLIVDTLSQVKVEISGGTSIEYTLAAGQSIFDAGDGSAAFGNVLIARIHPLEEPRRDLAVQLAGTFEQPVLVADQATVTALPGAALAKVQIATLSKEKVVTLQGTFNRTEVLREAHLEIDDESAVSTITLYANTDITIAKTGKIGKIDQKNEADVIIDGEGANNVSGQPL